MQTTYKNVHLLPSLSHVNSDGSQIGGVDPANYSSEILKTSLMMYTSGAKTPGYPAWMWYPAAPLPLQAEFSKISLDIEFILGGSIESLNTVETDILVAAQYANGPMRMYNRSAQFVQDKGFQIADTTGGWVDTNVKPGPLRVYNTYRFVYEHVFNLGSSVSNTSSVTMNGVKSVVEQSPIAAPTTTWSPAGIYVQVQQGSLPSAEPWTLKIKKLTITQS